MGGLCGGGGPRGAGEGRHPEPGRPAGEPATGRRFRPLAGEDGPGARPDGSPGSSGCPRGRHGGGCGAADTALVEADGSDCPRRRVNKVLGLAARLGGSCTSQPPPLVVLPVEDGP